MIVATLEDAAHWSRRSMAKRSGLSRSAIGQIWRDFGLRPHLADGFRLSTDPQFAEKVVDVVGLCHNPPEKAVVLCVDEKSQIQAYPGDDPGLCDGGQEPDMTGSGSLTDGISGVSPQRSQRPRTDAHGRSACPARAVSPLTEPGTHPGLVLAASVTDASATASPARTYPPAIRTPDNQALDQSQPVLPGMPGRRTRDYVRHGITTLFAASGTAGPTVLGEIHRQHRAAESRKFPVTIGKTVPESPGIHLVCDNYGTRKTPAIKAWLARHPRVKMHFTPAGSPWTSQVERWLGFLTDQMIRRGAHKSVQSLEADIRARIEHWNDDPKPFVWKKTADEIPDSLARYLQRTPGAAH